MITQVPIEVDEAPTQPCDLFHFVIEDTGAWICRDDGSWKVEPGGILMVVPRADQDPNDEAAICEFWRGSIEYRTKWRDLSLSDGRLAKFTIFYPGDYDKLLKAGREADRIRGNLMELVYV